MPGLRPDTAARCCMRTLQRCTPRAGQHTYPRPEDGKIFLDPPGSLVEALYICKSVTLLNLGWLANLASRCLILLKMSQNTPIRHPPSFVPYPSHRDLKDVKPKTKNSWSKCQPNINIVKLKCKILMPNVPNNMSGFLSLCTSSDPSGQSRSPSQVHAPWIQKCFSWHWNSVSRHIESLLSVDKPASANQNQVLCH